MLALLLVAVASAEPDTKAVQGASRPVPTAHTPGEWSPAPALGQPRAAHAVVAARGALYALGGIGAGGRPVLEVERFDGVAWKAVGTIPGSGLNAPAAAALAGRIYLIGGFNTTTNVPTDRVSVYDVTSGVWNEAAPLPAPRGGHAAVVLDGRVHVFGGGNSVSTLADHSVYDPASNRWRAAAPLPRAVGSPAGAALGGEIYAIGGRSGSLDFGDVFIYSPPRDAWRNGPAIEPRGTAGAVSYCGRIHLFGGESQSARRNLAEVLRLDLERGVWAPLAPMATARNFARAVVLGSHVYVVGGSLRPQTDHAPPGSPIVERFHDRCEP